MITVQNLVGIATSAGVLTLQKFQYFGHLACCEDGSF